MHDGRDRSSETVVREFPDAITRGRAMEAVSVVDAERQRERERERVLEVPIVVTWDGKPRNEIINVRVRHRPHPH